MKMYKKSIWGIIGYHARTRQVARAKVLLSNMLREKHRKDKRK